MRAGVTRTDAFVVIDPREELARGLLPNYAAAKHAAQALTNRLDAANPGTVTAAKIVCYDVAVLS
jgi:hypothetical protein